MVSVLIQENSSWMKEERGEGGIRPGSLSRRGKDGVIRGNTIQKIWLQMERIIERRRGEGYKEETHLSSGYKWTEGES